MTTFISSIKSIPRCNHISYDDQQWGFYYDGGGRVDVTVNADGSVSLAPSSEGSQVVIGDGQPKCRVP